MIGSAVGRWWPNQPEVTNGKIAVSSLWVSKVDLDGNLLWEKTIEEDEGAILDALLMSCSTPVLGQKGDIVFAVNLKEQPSIVKDGVRLLAGREVRLLPSRYGFTFVMRFDKDGKELSRKRIDDSANPKIARTEAGYVLFENPVPVLERGIRRTYFDGELNQIEQREIKRRVFLSRLLGCYLAAMGDFMPRDIL